MTDKHHSRLPIPRSQADSREDSCDSPRNGKHIRNPSTSKVSSKSSPGRSGPSDTRPGATASAPPVGSKLSLLGNSHLNKNVSSPISSQQRTPRHIRTMSEQVHVQSSESCAPKQFDYGVLQADFNELRRCFAEIAFTVAKQTADMQTMKEEIEALRSGRLR